MSGGAAVYHPTYWCHSCDMSITLPPSPTLLCPHCHSHSLQQMDNTSTSDDNFLLHSLIDHLTATTTTKHSSLAELPITDPTLLCPICKDPFLLNSLAKSMPCTHCYHSECILPWLDINNSCPVCRFRLPPPVVVDEESVLVGFLSSHADFMDDDDDETDLYGIRTTIRRLSASQGNLFS